MRTKEQISQYQKSWYQKNRKRLLEHHQINKEKIKEVRTLTLFNLKIEVLTYYSDGFLKCVCCGEKHIEFLSIDHIGGGGRQQKLKLKRWGINFYRWLRQNNFPKGYRVLCHNCNQAIGFYGYCPHQLEK